MQISESSVLSVEVLFIALVRRWRFIAIVAVGAGLLCFIGSFLLHNQFTSETTFVPESRKTSRLPGNLAGLASQFGIDFGDEGNDSPAFYADLVKSREVITRVLGTRFPDYRRALPGDSVALIALLGATGSTIPLRLENGIEKLAKGTDVSVNARTGVITLRVTSRWPGLAHDVAKTFLTTINDFNLHRRTTQAALRRRFAEERSADALAELRRNEDALREFQIRNRSTTNSPTLQSEQRAIERQISISQDVYLATRQQLESARMEEVNDTPVITVIDEPSIPGRKSGPKRGLIAIFAALLGVMTASLLVLFPLLTRSSPSQQDASNLSRVLQRA